MIRTIFLIEIKNGVVLTCIGTLALVLTKVDLFYACYAKKKSETKTKILIIIFWYSTVYYRMAHLESFGRNSNKTTI